MQELLLLDNRGSTVMLIFELLRSASVLLETLGIVLSKRWEYVCVYVWRGGTKRMRNDALFFC